MRHFFNFLVAVSVISISSCNSGNLEPRVHRLYSKMSPEARVAQLRSIYISELFTPAGRLDEERCRWLIPNGIGHVSQFAMDLGRTPAEQRDMVAQLQHWLMTNTPGRIPALVHEEALSGVNSLDATVYPQQIGMACTFNTELAEKKTRLTGRALRSMGGLLALSPMVDVVRNPAFNRLEESYGEDGYLSAAMGAAFVKGLQHRGNLKKGVAACTKHFLGYGGGGDAPEKELMEDILLPHEAIIRTAGSQVVMTGYHTFHGTKCVASSHLQQDLLRGYVGFDGLTVSDYGSIPQIGDSIPSVRLCAAAMNAGNDVDFPVGAVYAHIPEAMKEGLVSGETVERSVKNVLRLKGRLGMLDKSPYLYSREKVEFDTPEERALARKLATQSMVLLKNCNAPDASYPILPLNAEKLASLGGRIMLTGPNANSMWALAGDYSFHAMRYFWKNIEESPLHPEFVTLKMGMEQGLPAGATLCYARGCDWTETPETVMEVGGDPRVAAQKILDTRMVRSGEPADWDEALRLARGCDVIVAAMGENVMLSGENRNRTKLTLPGRQEEYVRALVATGKPVVLVLFGGRAQVLGSLADECAAVLQAWYPGEEGGNAAADILFGKVSPSGKLSVSYPARELNEPVCYNYGAGEDPRIAWPFGFGLSYSAFEYGNLRMPAEVKMASEFVDLEFDVHNSGDMDADEVVQIYVSPRDATSPLKPIQLQGFGRASLRRGDTKRVCVRLYTEQLGYFADGGWNVAPGHYIVKVGASSRDIRLQKEIKLTGDAKIMKNREHYFSEVRIR